MCECVNKCSLVLWQNVGVLASSASGSVGWLAASMMYFALMASTLSLGEEENRKDYLLTKMFSDTEKNSSQEDTLTELQSINLIEDRMK